MSGTSPVKITVNVTAGAELAGKVGRLVMYLHDKALADAPASVAAEHQLSMSPETVCLEANPDAEQIGKKAAEMVMPSYYISVTGDVIGDPAYTPVVHDQVVDLKLKLRS
mmetsp:Transcript_73956/g.163328  ORF Transcript_73956/g.163328 Transcript_73956/m.163328 type:complete len:110 (-) Transcript_73956:110-439(-)